MQKKSTYKYIRLRDVREDSDYSQREIADYLNLYLTTYRRYENGECTIPVNLLRKLSKLYNVSIDFLVEYEEEIKHQ